MLIRLSTWSCLDRMQDKVTVYRVITVQIFGSNLNKSEFFSGRN